MLRLNSENFKHKIDSMELNDFLKERLIKAIRSYLENEHPPVISKTPLDEIAGIVGRIIEINGRRLRLSIKMGIFCLLPVDDAKAESL